MFKNQIKDHFIDYLSVNLTEDECQLVYGLLEEYPPKAIAIMTVTFARYILGTMNDPNPTDFAEWIASNQIAATVIELFRIEKDQIR